MRAVARRRSALVAESRGRFGNAASVRARHREAGGNCQTPPRGCPSRSGVRLSSPGRDGTRRRPPGRGRAGSAW
ncbi:hypothetical protein DWC19_08000 [Streptomyces sp. M7]|nr:hypothetical protein DWC19_08000 [Streptomyces sp. M7]